MNAEIKTKHTPGPWRAILLGPFGAVNVVALDGKPVAFTGVDKRAQNENEANARLISLAPEMAEALRRLVSAVETSGLTPHERRGSDLALREAEARAILSRLQ